MTSSSNKLRSYLIRLILIVAISTGFVFAFNEVVYLFQKDKLDRAPKTIELIIPNGTAQRIESGANINLFPQDSVFMIGDVLSVKNEDSTSHQLGPLWIPPEASATLVLRQSDKFSYSCSFQSSRYLGFDVRQPTTLATRLLGLGIAAPTMASLLFLYSLAVFPLKSNPDTIRRNFDKREAA